MFCVNDASPTDSVKNSDNESESLLILANMTLPAGTPDIACLRAAFVIAILLSFELSPRANVPVHTS